jgi:hypothetical protein
MLEAEFGLRPQRSGCGRRPPTDAGPGFMRVDALVGDNGRSLRPQRSHRPPAARIRRRLTLCSAWPRKTPRRLRLCSRVVVPNANHLEAPAPQRDGVTWTPREDGTLDRRPDSRRPVQSLELEGERHPALLIRDRTARRAYPSTPHVGGPAQRRCPDRLHPWQHGGSGTPVEACPAVTIATS